MSCCAAPQRNKPTEVQHPAAAPAGSRPSSVPPLKIQNRKATKKKTVQVQGVNAADMLEYQSLFADFDVDGSGSIDSKELRAAMARLGLQMTAAEIAKMIEEADANHDGKIDFGEFVAMVNTGGLEKSPNSFVAAAEAVGKWDDARFCSVATSVNEDYFSDSTPRQSVSGGSSIVVEWTSSARNSDSPQPRSPQPRSPDGHSPIENGRTTPPSIDRRTRGVSATSDEDGSLGDEIWGTPRAIIDALEPESSPAHLDLAPVVSKESLVFRGVHTSEGPGWCWHPTQLAERAAQKPAEIPSAGAGVVESETDLYVNSHVATELLADRLPGLLFPATRSKNYNIVMYNLRLKKGSGKLAPAGAPCDASGRYYDADDVDPAKPIAVFWHLIDQGMLKSRGKKGQGVVDPLTMIEKRGFQTHAWRLDSGVWQFHVTSLAKLVFTIEFCDGHPVATTPVGDDTIYVEKFHIQLKYGWSVSYVLLYGIAKSDGRRITHTYDDKFAKQK